MYVYSPVIIVYGPLIVITNPGPKSATQAGSSDVK